MSTYALIEPLVLICVLLAAAAVAWQHIRPAPPRKPHAADQAPSCASACSRCGGCELGNRKRD